MKRFQRVNAFILAMALLISTIPAGILNLKTVAAEPEPVLGKTFLHAAYAASEVAVNGELDTIYRLDVPVGTLRIGAAWNMSNLYLAVNTDNTADLTIKVNGEAVNGGISAGNTCTEYRISLRDAKITDLTGTNILTVQFGNATPVELNLVFGVNEYAQNVFLTLDKATAAGQVDSGKSTAAIINGSNKTVQGAQARSQAAAAASIATSTVVEFDVSDLTLPNSSSLPAKGTGWTPGRSFCTGGLSVSLRDNLDSTNTSAMLFSLSNKNGNPVFTYFDNHNNGTDGFVQVAVAAAETYHIRVEFNYTDDAAPVGTLDVNDTVSAKYFVNGVCVAQGNSVRQIGGSKGTTQTNIVQFYALAPTNTQLEATVSDVSVTKHDPSASTKLAVVKNVMDLIDAIADPITMDSKAAIVNAREQYERLDAVSKDMVANLSKLENAEAELNKLENSYLHAVFSASAVTVDGKLQETAYRRTLPLSGTLNASVAWDAAKLYLAFKGSNVPNVTQLTINGITVTDPGKTGTGTREIGISLGAIGINDLSKSYPITMVADGITWSGMLVLDDVDFSVLPHNDLFDNATSLNNKESFKLDTWYTIKDTDRNYSSLAMVKTDKLTSVTGLSTVIEFDMTDITLPEGYTVGSTPSRTSITNGITVTVRDDTDVRTDGTNGQRAFLFGFGKKNGQLHLISWYFDAATQTYKNVKVPVGLSDSYHFRVEYTYGVGTAVAARYYVNGVMVHEQSDSLIYAEGSFGTTHSNLLQFYAFASKNSASATHKVVATVHNVSVGHTQLSLANDLTVEVPKVEALIEAIGSPVTLDSKDKIQAALEAYHNLSDLAKSQVSNLEALETARTRLQMLEKSYIHAAYSSEELSLDGKIFESAYRMNVKITDTLKFGAAWTKNYLYLAFEDETAPVISDLVINGTKVVLNPSNSKCGMIGSEICLSLSSLGIVGYDKTYSISFRIGDIYWGGTLVQDSNDYEPLPHGYIFFGAVGSSDKTALSMNTVLPDANGENKDRSLGMFTHSKFGSVSGLFTIVELDLEINQMPDNCTVVKTPGRNFIKDGVTFTYLDDLSPAPDGAAAATESLAFGLGKENGKLKLYYWYNDATGKAVLGSVDVPAADSYHFRVEYGNGNGKVSSARYFINGILLAETESSRVTASTFGTKHTNALQVFALATTQTEAGRVDLRVSNVSASHSQLLVIDDKSAAANMDAVINAIGEVTFDSTEKIVAARTLYNSLTSAQKKLVTKLAVLEAAEAKLQTLKNQINNQFTTYVFAEYTGKEMTVDGKLEEGVWHSKQTIFGSGYLGLAWDYNYLYLAITSAKLDTFKNLKINGQSVTDLGKVNGNVREIRVLLSSVGIKKIDITQGYDLSFSLNGKTWEAELMFDTSDYSRSKPSSVSWGGTKDLYNGYLNTVNSTYGNRVCVIYNHSNLQSVNGVTTVLELDLKINDMPNNGYTNNINANPLVGGVSVCVRDEDATLAENGYGNEGFVFGLLRQKGNMYLVYWEDSTDEFIYVPAEDFGTKNYHIRVEYEYHTNDDVSAKYYVNGLLLAESYDAKEIAETGIFSTSTNTRIQIVAYSTDEGHVDAVVSDLSVAKTRDMENPDPREEITKETIFGVLDLNHVQKDLVLPAEYVTISGERFALTWLTSDSSVVTDQGKVTRLEENVASAVLTLIVGGEEWWDVTIKVDPMSLEEFASPEDVDAAFSKSPIVIDGILDDEGWRMSGRVLDKNKQIYAEYGFQWTQSFLYIAVEYLDGIDSLSLKLNGRYFTLKDGKLCRGGEDVGGSGALVVTNGNVVELRLPLSALGLPGKVSSYNYSMPMSLKAGPYVGSGKVLRLSNIDWFLTTNRNQETPGEQIVTNNAYHGVQRLANGYRLFDLYGGDNETGLRSAFNLSGHEILLENLSDRTYDTRIEFDFYAEAMPIQLTDGTAWDKAGGIRSISGITFSTGVVNNSSSTQDNYVFGIINTANGLTFVLNIDGRIQTHLLNKKVGEKFSIAVEWCSDDSLLLFMDGAYITTFYDACSKKTGRVNANLAANLYTFFEKDDISDNLDVYITNIAIGKIHREENILNQLDFEDIRGKNTLADKITSDLILPGSITNGQMDTNYKITWTSNNPAVDAATGKVTRPAIGVAAVTLTATLPNGETKNFELIVYGTKAQNDGILYVQNDLDPANGIGKTSKDIYFTFDETNNSIIKRMDGKVKVNFVVLKDGDDKARLLPENLTLWVSDDNKTYTRIKDFKLLQVGEKWYLYDFEAECTYVKVHYTQPDAEESCFTGTYGEMIDAGYQKVFGAGDNVTFTQSTYVLTNNTGKDRLDYAWTISKKTLGITGTDAAIRIYADGKLQYHYVSGNDVVVRINDLAAGASVTLTVLSSSNQSVMDISNKEGVHEVIYGVRETITTDHRWYYMTLPAGTTFPDGSKLEVETIFAMNRNKFSTSTDGGVTWVAGTVLNNAPAGKNPVVKFSEGGWIFDSVTGRMMFEFYYTPDEETAFAERHMHISVACSDDGGKTWYLQYTMPCRLCSEGCLGDYFTPSYALTYNDGTQLSTYDGKGPNVDFVFPVGNAWTFKESYQCAVIYTTDAGETWHYSKTFLTHDTTSTEPEAGTSEGWIIERSDGVLVLQIRCQDGATHGFKVCYSYDKGLTWTNETVITDHYAVNGQALLKYMEVNGETTMISAWSGNTSMGGDTYHRNPFVFASSANDGETFRNIQNSTFRSFEEDYEHLRTLETTNVSLTRYGDGNLIYNYRRNANGDYVITNIEDFDDWFTRTKGGYDNFEHGTVRYEGWQKVFGTNALATDIARGKYSMKLSVESKVVRSVPYLQDGKVSVDIYVPAGGGFTLELQSGYTRYYNSVSVPIAIRCENGKIYFGDSTTPAAEGIKAGWNTLVFDLNLTEDQATMSVNGGAAVKVPLKMDFDDYVNFIVIGTDEATQIYVDEVLIVSDLEPDLAVDEADKKAAAKVVELIKAINTASDRNAAIKAARAAFDKLTQAQQDLIDARVLAGNGKSGLDAMINYYDELRLAEDGHLIVMEMIEQIGEVTHRSGETLDAIDKAYNKLTWAQKQKVTNYGDLRVARLRYDRIVSHKSIKDQQEVENVQELIDNLILSNPLRFETKVKAARKAYNALSGYQLAQVDARKLYQVELRIAQAKEVETARRLSSLQQLINSLDNITLESTALIEGLRTTVNKLTTEERAVLDDQKLVEAEKVIRNLKVGLDKKTLVDIRINGIMANIEAIGQVTIEKKAFIDAIRASYNKLTAKQKERVENYDKLVIAEGQVLVQLQLTDTIPNTGETKNVGVTPMPVMLLCTLAMAALALVPGKRKRRQNR